MAEKKELYCLVGASGSGKSTLAKYMKKNGVVELISHTTRAPREKDREIHGVHYYFVSEEEFDRIEKIEESPYSGEHRYGISAGEMNSKFEIYSRLFTIVDLNGANQIKKRCLDKDVDVKIIYIQTDLQTMKKRMKERGDSLENINKRLEFAQKSNELANDKFADYIIDNRGALEDSVDQLIKILNKSENSNINIVEKCQYLYIITTVSIKKKTEDDLKKEFEIHKIKYPSWKEKTFEQYYEFQKEWNWHKYNMSQENNSYFLDLEEAKSCVERNFADISDSGLYNYVLIKKVHLAKAYTMIDVEELYIFKYERKTDTYREVSLYENDETKYITSIIDPSNED